MVRYIVWAALPDDDYQEEHCWGRFKTQTKAEQFCWLKKQENPGLRLWIKREGNWESEDR